MPLPIPASHGPMEMNNEPGQQPDPNPAPGAPTLAPAPEAPRTATIVVQGKSQREIELETTLEEERRLRREREQRINDLEDQNLQRREVPPAPAKPSKKAGWTLFHESED